MFMLFGGPVQRDSEVLWYWKYVLKAVEIISLGSGKEHGKRNNNIELVLVFYSGS